MQPWATVRWAIVLWLLVLLLDVAANVVVLLQLHGWSLRWLLNADDWRTALTHFQDDVLDAALLTVVRVTLLLSLFHLGISVGTPQWAREEQAYEAAMAQRAKAEVNWRSRNASSVTRRTERTHSAPKQQTSANLTEPLLHFSLNGNGDIAAVGPLPTSPVIAGSRAAGTTHLPSDEEDASSSGALPSLAAFLGPAPAAPPALNLTQKLAMNREAQWKLRWVQVFIFVAGTAFQVFLGVKMVAFNFGDGGREVVCASLLGVSLLATNAEAGLLRSILRGRLQEEGVLVPFLHPHKLYYMEEDIKGNHCDWCRNRVPGGYTCRGCDIDVCLPCFERNKIKHANGRRSEGLVAHTLREPTESGPSSQQAREIGSASFMLRALGMARPHWRLVLPAVGCLLLTSAAAIALPSFQGQILDHVVKGEHSAFLYSIKVFVCVSVALGLFGCVRNLCFSIVGARIAAELRVQLFAVIMGQSVDFFDAATSGELHQRLGWDTSNTATPIQSALSSALSNLLLLAGGCAMCIVTSWRLSVLAFCALYPIAIITKAYAQWSSLINRDIMSSYGEATNVAGQAIGNIRTVHAFGTAQMETEQYNSYVNEGLRKSVKDAYAGGASYALTSYLDLATSVLLLWWGGSVVLDDNNKGDSELTIGKLITFQLYWNLMSSSYTSLQDLLTVFTRSSGSAQRVFTLLDNLPRTDPTAGVRVKHVSGDLVLEDVCFSYALRSQNRVLNKVNLHIKKGTVTALVGRSGGGKSTIVSLLMRLYDPTEGRILVDGVDLRSLNTASLFRHFAVVQQATELFGGSILQNLTYGLSKEEWSMAAVHAACLQANCLDFILSFEEGFSTRVGERGVRLSGGERQRLSIARAMLRQASVLLLDEATSSLDGESESLVQAALDALIARGHCTILLVAHRLSTVVNAQQIAVLDGGRIVERGTHDELMSTEGSIYCRLVQRQLARKQNLIDADAAAEADANSAQPISEEEKAEAAAKRTAFDDVDAVWDEEERQQPQNTVAKAQ